MNILALDTSSSACSVALLNNQRLIERHELLENRHSRFVLEFVDDLIRQANIQLHDLDAVAVGNGPGSFTGLRLGMGVAQGLAYGINKPLIPISSLHAIAQTSDANNIIVAVDARMGEVYWQCFQLNQNKDLVALGEAKLDRPEAIKINLQGLSWQGLGTGFDNYAEQMSALLEAPDNWTQDIFPRATSIIKLAQTAIRNTGLPSEITALPVYVRNKVTHG